MQEKNIGWKELRVDKGYFQGASMAGQLNPQRNKSRPLLNKVAIFQGPGPLRGWENPWFLTCDSRSSRNDSQS
ncbi:hypothetical protein CDAR_516291 [Caerostris darwini]|uniref:Ycf15 n=1 Tax=Caerostris darwini TaxID=1538125 RepID=A0AAV4X2Q2_9ARAC|nr:hypothetical protein CDAR_516291 [Caerostris darwini]